MQNGIICILRILWGALNPDLKERLKGRIECIKCGVVRSWEMDRSLALDELVDRLEALEEKVSKLEKE